MKEYIAFIKKICNEILKIKPPALIMAEDDAFSTPTMLAKLNATERTIYIRKNIRRTPDIFFAISHELRHLWQFEKEFDRFCKGKYKIENAGSEEYNLQPAEVDANAFGKIVMVEFFRLAPQFEGVPDAVKNEIEKRVQEIVKAGF